MVQFLDMCASRQAYPETSLETSLYISIMSSVLVIGYSSAELAELSTTSSEPVLNLKDSYIVKQKTSAFKSAELSSNALIGYIQKRLTLVRVSFIFIETGFSTKSVVECRLSHL
jgi:hypothetical protein